MLHVSPSVQRTAPGAVLLRPLRYTAAKHSASTSMATIAMAKRRATPPATPIAASTAMAAVATTSTVPAVFELVTVSVYGRRRGEVLTNYNYALCFSMLFKVNWS